MDHVDEATIVMNEVTQTTLEAVLMPLSWALLLVCSLIALYFVIDEIRWQLGFKKRFGRWDN